MKGNGAGSVVVITGATGGAGSAVARALSEAGYLLVLNSPSMEKLTALASELTGPCTVVAGSLTDESLPETLLYAALDRFGRCDVCISNGVLFEAGIIETVDIDRLITMVKVNVEGTVRIAYAFLKHFVSEGAGHLVNVSHGVGSTARPTVFAATQSAIEIISDALATELDGTDVHVTSIKPGQVKTGLHVRWEVGAVGPSGAAEPLEPEDFARMILFILELTSKNCDEEAETTEEASQEIVEPETNEELASSDDADPPAMDNETED